MLKYIFKRVLQVIPMLLIVSFIVFSLIQLAPYDAIDSITTPNMSSETVELLRQKHGLDQPFLVQYMMWLKEILQGNFGYSLVSQQSIGQELLIRIPNTIKLILPAYLTALILSIALGLVAGANKGKFVDKLIDGICSVGISMPTFWFAMLLIYLLGYKLDLLPIIGMHTVGQEDSFVDFLQHFIMPYLVLVVAFFPDLTRYVRSSTLLQLSEDYVMVQKSFGATKKEIFFKHVSKNVLLPIVTQLGLALPMLVTGAIITESIFGWPGIGPYLMSATKALDFPVIMAVMLLSATLVILGNLLSDVLYTVVDPRISQGDK
ncbi:peptide/nickel transport system permease protein [Vagococcus fluvialis]|uniref:Peptide permease n=1 Tax=Vagococcus fluvialis TaxID=2738 RepID=A0A369AP79_9ENTE|nr:ABC transporter permease [Vagococcus fluvialis]MBO0444670.1 ABC transporter permease [Vagococcus fluvialis]RCX10007.1 peptide/nickel transport system permease protein [Vagococcus fluvialis]RST98515.1 peptide permease [Vagococcus fluvialis]UDM80016.1 ABC transporter permease [Vagococcus fluvialis]WNF89408.1 ABC transporter permease [Vagococcus fluvialis]